jgi:hypothetical protein
MVCGETSEMEVDSVALYRWQTMGVLIQYAFPDMPIDERELLKSGTHGSCWDQIFGSEDEDDDALDYADPDPMQSINEDNHNL